MRTLFAAFVLFAASPAWAEDHCGYAEHLVTLATTGEHVCMPVGHRLTTMSSSDVAHCDKPGERLVIESDGKESCVKVEHLFKAKQ